MERRERCGVRRGVVVDVESGFKEAAKRNAIRIRTVETARMIGIADLRTEGRGRDRTDVPVVRRVAVRSRGDWSHPARPDCGRRRDAIRRLGRVLLRGVHRVLILDAQAIQHIGFCRRHSFRIGDLTRQPGHRITMVWFPIDRSARIDRNLIGGPTHTP